MHTDQIKAEAGMMEMHWQLKLSMEIHYQCLVCHFALKKLSRVMLYLKSYFVSVLHIILELEEK